MLQFLNIQNFTIISELELEFENGMTVLTGETGAGKSILIDALLLALGGRAENSIIKHGEERCSITASFIIDKLPTVQQWLTEHELSEDKECILRRTINLDGRSRAFINGQTVPVQLLRELGSLLVNIHGQHENQNLIKPDKQRSLLDAYGNLIPLTKKTQQLYNDWHKAQDALHQLQTQNKQNQERYDLLKYQVQELDKLALQADELEHLDKEQRQLANAGSLLENGQKTINLLDENGETNIISLLNTAHQQILHLQRFDTKFNEIAELINNALINAEEANNELQRYFDKFELNPERLEWVEQRLSSIHEFARKHRINPNELIALHQRLAHELDQIENSDIHLEKLQSKVEELAQDYLKTAEELSKKRLQTAKKLAPLVTEKIQELGMPGGRFHIEISRNANNAYSSYGLEKIEFQVSANPGQSLQPLAKVASGGELSRMSLAIHVLTAQNETTPTLIFDEVDVGIGGGTAEIVGLLLRSLAKHSQILCVTHLPQVAAQGHHHIQVGKTTSNKTTKTQVAFLDKASKIQEIARMLGGLKITNQTLAHAREMVEAND